MVSAYRARAGCYYLLKSPPQAGSASGVSSTLVDPYQIVLCRTVLHQTVLCQTVLYRTVLHQIVLYQAALC